MPASSLKLSPKSCLLTPGHGKSQPVTGSRSCDGSLPSAPPNSLPPRSQRELLKQKPSQESSAYNHPAVWRLLTPAAPLLWLPRAAEWQSGSLRVFISSWTALGAPLPPTFNLWG